MKKKIFLTIILFLFSYYYTYKCINFLKYNDILMQEIIKKQYYYNKEPSNAIITANTMIPCVNGYQVNLNESYKKMKKINKFDQSLLVYDKIKCQKSISNYYDKVIISGNKTKNNISIILNIDEEELFDVINKILITNNVYGNILSNKKLDISNTNYKNIVSYQYNSFTDYCITKNLQVNKMCKDRKTHTVLVRNISNLFLINTKNIIENGIIIIYNFNKNNYNELNIVIKYLKNNNYHLVSIDELIKE